MSIMIGAIVVVILGSFFVPDVRTMMGFGARQVDQPVVVAKASSATPQAPKLNFQYEPVRRNVDGHLTYGMIIWVTTDAAMQGFQLRIACDTACIFESAHVDKDANLLASQIGDRSVEISFNRRFDSSQKCKIVLRGTAPFHISAIQRT